jgi:hypothetical protein
MRYDILNLMAGRKSPEHKLPPIVQRARTLIQSVLGSILVLRDKIVCYGSGDLAGVQSNEYICRASVHQKGAHINTHPAKMQAF